MKHFYTLHGNEVLVYKFEITEELIKVLTFLSLRGGFRISSINLSCAD